MNQDLHCVILIPNTHDYKRAGLVVGGTEKQTLKILQYLGTVFKVINSPT